MSQNKNPIFKNSGETDSFYGAPRTKSKYSTPPLRPRINQPTGYRGMKSTTPMMRSVNHDYVYYPLTGLMKEPGNGMWIILRAGMM